MLANRLRHFYLGRCCPGQRHARRWPHEHRRHGEEAGGTGIGTLRVRGAHVQSSSGHLAIDLGSSLRDLLAVTGTVSLHGHLAAHDVGTYRPALNAKFRVVTGAGITYSGVCVCEQQHGRRYREWVRPERAATAVYLIWRCR